MGVEGFKEDLEKGYEDERNDPKYKGLFRNYRREPVTADTIKTEAEKPFQDAAQVLAAASKLGLAYQAARLSEYTRLRYQQFPFRGGDAPLIDVKSTSPNPESIINPIFDAHRFKRIHSYENRPVYIPKEELAPFQKGEPLMSTTGGSGDDEQLNLDFEGVGDDIVPFQESSRLQSQRNPEGLTIREILASTREGIYKFSNPQIQRHLRLAGVNDAGIFLMSNWDNTLGTARPHSRTGAAAVQRPGMTQQIYDLAKEEHWVTWNEYFNHLGLQKGDLQLHHVATLKGSLPLYDDLEVGGQEWKEMDVLLQSLGVWPGNHPKNFEMMTKANHDAIHRYTDLTIGDHGQVFFTQERMDRLTSGPEGRLEVAREYAKLVNDSRRMMVSIQEQFELMNSGKPIDPELAYRVLEFGMQIREVVDDTDFESPGFTNHLRGAIDLVSRDMRLLKAVNSKKGWTNAQKEAYREYLRDSPLPYLKEDYAPDYNPDLPKKYRVESTRTRGDKLIRRLLKETGHDNIHQLELDLLYDD